jgi:hypothetical protein
MFPLQRTGTHLVLLEEKIIISPQTRRGTWSHAIELSGKGHEACTDR